MLTFTKWHHIWIKWRDGTTEAHEQIRSGKSLTFWENREQEPTPQKSKKNKKNPNWLWIIEEQNNFESGKFWGTGNIMFRENDDMVKLWLMNIFRDETSLHLLLYEGLQKRANKTKTVQCRLIQEWWIKQSFRWQVLKDRTPRNSEKMMRWHIFIFWSI